jgi:hypothetical protein
MPTSPIAARRVRAPDLGQLRGNLPDGHVPRDALEGAIAPAAQRVLDALRVLHVVRDAERLVADVPGGDRVALVGADRGDATVGNVEPDTAVVAAEDTDRRRVGGVERQECPRYR